MSTRNTSQRCGMPLRVSPWRYTGRQPRSPAAADASSENRSIADEPIINFVHRHVPGLLLMGFVLLVIYCSLLPFDFVPPQWSTGHKVAFMGLSISEFNMPDIMLNIALYVPIGAGIFTVLQ